MSSRPSPAAFLAALALVVAVGLPTGTAVAHALTPASVKKVAKKTADKEIAKKAPGLSVAHAANATNADALGGVPSSGYERKGAITMSLSSSGWLNSQPTAVNVYRMPAESQFYAAVGLQFFNYPIALPVQLGGTPVTLTTLRYCYRGSPGVHLTSERFAQFTFEGGTGTLVGPAVLNSFDLGDTACRTFTLNRALGPHDQVSLELGANWTVANSALRLGAVTATFSPS